MDKLISAIGWEYMRTKALVCEDGQYDLVRQQKGFQFIYPNEDWFPGVYWKIDLLLEKYIENKKHDLLF